MIERLAGVFVTILLASPACGAQVSGAQVPSAPVSGAPVSGVGGKVTIDQARGIDSRVDYASLAAFGPWDDRNYRLTLDDLALLADNESDLNEAVPAFFRVELRRDFELLREGRVQYPRSALPRFLVAYSGYLVAGTLYRSVERVAGEWRFLHDGALALEQVEREVLENGREVPVGFLEGEARVTNPESAAESAVAINPVDSNVVIAGSNGPGGGQKMHFSTDGGESWNQAAPLPLGGTCCDPTVAWSTDGTKGYAATLGSAVWFYRTGDGGATWDDLGGDPRREIGSGVDKEYLHVDSHPGSQRLDNIYLTWHQGNVMQFSRSTDLGDTWSAPLAFPADDRGIGSDIATDGAGDIYYLYPAFNTRTIRLKKSTDGGLSFAPQSTVATTEASFIFPVPSMDVREVFIYVSADVDRSGGPFGDSIYAAWTDSTAPTTNDPNDNHARIQVAYSRDGGGTWMVTTPHETVDADTVDRWHQWLSVAPDGSVHVIFYDTRRDLPNRAQVDVFYSMSSDGAQTWSMPTRLTAEQSPNISGSFEFGDYNGLDLVMNDLIAVYTDNRPEGESQETGDDSVDIYAAGRVLDISLIFADGFESGDTSAWSLAIP